jgi:hypothetical protein
LLRLPILRVVVDGLGATHQVSHRNLKRSTMEISI